MQTSSPRYYPKKGYPNIKLLFKKPPNFYSMKLFQMTWGYHFDLLAPPGAIRIYDLRVSFRPGRFQDIKAF